jgi:hypothetical protein
MANAIPVTEIRDDVIATINEVLKRRLGRFGFTRAQIRAGEDHDGDPVLFIDARYKLSDDPVDAAETAGARSEIHKRLLALGESRFPHIKHHFVKGQPILGVR